MNLFIAFIETSRGVSFNEMFFLGEGGGGCHCDKLNERLL